jgi:7-carboxy-7-deazaguanine synthase
MDMQNKDYRLPVSEVFYSIQGEGQTMGVPSVFLRLGGCNILCQSKHWVCDTIEVWRKSKSTPFDEILSEEFTKRIIEDDAHLVITGGEPLIHQNNIENFIEWFKETHKKTPIIEIETNGTILPSLHLLNVVKYWNCSPKLSNAGKQNKKETRINPMVLKQLNDMKKNTIFKFVVSNQEDIDEIFSDFYVGRLISKQNIVLMPAGSSQEELNETRLFVAEKARELGIRYSDRLHVVIWNLKTGV